ncbi:hypothetical protein TKK_0013369 [Trichogramma kaykai]
MVKPWIKNGCRGLAFRGDNQKFGSSRNGNYLGLFELLSNYDTFIKEHIEVYGNKGQGSTSYLSANICEEFIEIIGKRVLSHIINELKKSKYFSISVDSTPDITHTNQLTFILRYVSEEGPIERFLMFIPIEGHKAEYLTEVVTDFLSTNDIDINDCRGQSYDNASNMSGIYKGLQARLKQVNKYADYMPCAAHSLNLVGEKAAECVSETTAYFYFVQNIYTFSSASPHRWNKLTEALEPKQKVVKMLSNTRWSARFDAISALYASYENIFTALDYIHEEKTLTKDTQSEARSLLKKMKKFESVFMIVVWYDILLRINDTSKSLQKENTDLHVVVSLLKSLELYLLNLREKFEDYWTKANNFIKEAKIDVKTTVRERTRSIKITRFEGSSKVGSLSIWLLGLLSTKSIFMAPPDPLAPLGSGPTWPAPKDGTAVGTQNIGLPETRVIYYYKLASLKSKKTEKMKD